MMLEQTLSRPVLPGSNVRVDLTTTNWLYLLDSLDLGDVLVIGQPAPAMLETLCELGQRVHVCTGRIGAPTEPPGRPQLIVVLDPRAHDDPHRLVHECAAGGGSVLWAEPFNSPLGPPVGRLVPQWSTAPSDVLDAGGSGALGVPFGRSRPGRFSPVAERLQRVGARLQTRVLGGRGRRSDRHAGPRRTGDPDRGPSALVVTGGSGAPIEPTMSLLYRGPDRPLDQLPSWLTSAARANGIDLDPRWSFNPDGDYTSQKLLFLVSTGDEELAVKVTRRAMFSPRLANEYDSLRLLAHAGVPGIPAPRFIASHNGLTIVGQSRLGGESLSVVSDGTTACPHLLEAIDWANGLALEPSLRGQASREVVETAMSTVVRQFARLCQPGERSLAVLHQAVQDVAARPIPTVFLHGDLGTWNILVGPDGLGVLDWENGDPAGAPLWDVIHLVLSQAARSAAARGRRYRPGEVASDLRHGPWRHLLETAVAPQCAGLGIPVESLEPLTLLSWAHLAAKESTRRPIGSTRPGFWTRAIGSWASNGS